MQPIHNGGHQRIKANGFGDFGHRQIVIFRTQENNRSQHNGVLFSPLLAGVFVVAIDQIQRRGVIGFVQHNGVPLLAHTGDRGFKQGRGDGMESYQRHRVLHTRIVPQGMSARITY